MLSSLNTCMRKTDNCPKSRSLLGQNKVPLAILAAAIEPDCVRGSTDSLISQICYDSRKILPGALFVAIPGLHVDGHSFIDRALDAGAAAVVQPERGVVNDRAQSGCTAFQFVDELLNAFDGRKVGQHCFDAWRKRLLLPFIAQVAAGNEYLKTICGQALGTVQSDALCTAGDDDGGVAPVAARCALPDCLHAVCR